MIRTVAVPSASVPRPVSVVNARSMKTSPTTMIAAVGIPRERREACQGRAAVRARAHRGILTLPTRPCHAPPFREHPHQPSRKRYETDDTTEIAVRDQGCGPIPNPDSAGIHMGIPLMSALRDTSTIEGQPGQGTTVPDLGPKQQRPSPLLEAGKPVG
jgi:hypothetical protein